jgi:drug/metabolite transporter (DMT)-like permease
MPVPRWIAVMLALFVTFLWSTSYILNKWAFAEGIRPLTLAGARYTLAALTLFAVQAVSRRRSDGAAAAPACTAPDGGGAPEAGAVAAPGESPTAAAPRPPGLHQFALLGLAGYLVAQGFQYIGQYYVTPTQASMVLSFSNTTQVLIAGWLWALERPGLWQGLGIGLALSGVAAYYYPWHLEPGNLTGIAWIVASGAGYAAYLIANRTILRQGRTSPLNLTLYPMAVGAAGMLLLGLLLEPLPTVTVRLAWLLLWLGPVNGALAFFLWTYSQKALQAFESSILNNSMLLQIAALDVWLLGRDLGPGQALALLAAGAGILAVQAAPRTVPGSIGGRRKA